MQRITNAVKALEATEAGYKSPRRWSSYEMLFARNHIGFIYSWVRTGECRDEFACIVPRDEHRPLVEQFVVKARSKIRRIITLSLEMAKLIIGHGVPTEYDLAAEVEAMIARYGQCDRYIAAYFMAQSTHLRIFERISMRALCKYVLFGEPHENIEPKFLCWTSPGINNIVKEVFALPIEISVANAKIHLAYFHILSTFISELQHTETLDVEEISRGIGRFFSKVLQVRGQEWGQRPVSDADKARIIAAVFPFENLWANLVVNASFVDAYLVSHLADDTPKSNVFYFNAVFAIFTNGKYAKPIESVGDWTRVMETYGFRAKTARFESELGRLSEIGFFEYDGARYTLETLFYCSKYANYAGFAHNFRFEAIGQIRNPVLRQYLLIQLMKIYSYHAHMEPMFKSLPINCIVPIVDYLDPNDILRQYVYEESSFWVEKFGEIDYAVLDQPTDHE